jgi:hypothetical protein
MRTYRLDLTIMRSLPALSAKNAHKITTFLKQANTVSYLSLSIGTTGFFNMLKTYYVKRCTVIECHMYYTLQTWININIFRPQNRNHLNSRLIYRMHRWRLVSCSFEFHMAIQVTIWMSHHWLGSTSEACNLKVFFPVTPVHFKWYFTQFYNEIYMCTGSCICYSPSWYECVIYLLK